MNSKEIGLIQRQKKYIHKGFNSVTDKCFTDKQFISERKMRELFGELRFYVKKSLAEIFGKVGSYEDVNNYGILKNILSPHDIQSPALGIVFSYFSHQGAPIAYYKSNEGKERQDLYYKGTIWSDKVMKERWYNKFSIISRIVEKNVPIDFFSYSAVRHEIQKIKLLDVDYLNYYKNNTPDTINLPIFNYVEGISMIISTAFTELYQTIVSLKQENNISKNEAEEYYTKLSSQIPNAWDSIKKLDNTVFDKCANDIIDFFNQDNKIEKKDIFYMIIAYQLYEIPSQTLIYIPKINSSNNILYSSLAFQLPSPDIAFDSQIEQELLDYLNELNKICCLEEDIWKEAKMNYGSYLFWKDKYSKIVPQLEILENFYLAISKSVCVKKDIEILDIQSRIKDFDSFFNKMVIKANSESEIDIKEKYFSALTNHTLEDIRFIISNIQDIIGIRIITVYRDNIITFFREFVDSFVIPNEKRSSEPNFLEIKRKEIEKEILNLEKYYNNVSTGTAVRPEIDMCEKNINDKLKDIASSKNIINDVIIDKFEIYDRIKYDDYQSVQFNAHLGKARERLYEFQALKYPEIRVEIQIRSILQQGWADFSHDLLYKSKIPKELLSELLMHEEKSLTLLEHSSNIATLASKFTTTADIEFTNLKNEFKNKFKEYDL